LNLGRSFFGTTQHPIENLQPKFQEIWGNFGHMTIFWAKHRFFLPVRRGTKNLEVQMKNGLHFWIQHEKSRLLVLGQGIWARSESPGGQKHPKHDLSAPILTHRKQYWENEDLEGQMSTKFRNFSWVIK